MEYLLFKITMDFFKIKPLLEKRPRLEIGQLRTTHIEFFKDLLHFLHSFCHGIPQEAAHKGCSCCFLENCSKVRRVQQLQWEVRTEFSLHSLLYHQCHLESSISEPGKKAEHQGQFRGDQETSPFAVWPLSAHPSRFVQALHHPDLPGNSQ